MLLEACWAVRIGVILMPPEVGNITRLLSASARTQNHNPITVRADRFLGGIGSSFDHLTRFIFRYFHYLINPPQNLAGKPAAL